MSHALTIDRSGEDDIGLTGSAGGGLGSGADVSVGLFFEVSNATNLQQLKGQFYYASAGAQVLGGFNAIVFWNSDMSVVGIEVGVARALVPRRRLAKPLRGLISSTGSFRRILPEEFGEDDPKRVDFGDGPRHVGYAATSFCAG